MKVLEFALASDAVFGVTGDGLVRVQPDGLVPVDGAPRMLHAWVSPAGTLFGLASNAVRVREGETWRRVVAPEAANLAAIDGPSDERVWVVGSTSSFDGVCARRVGSKAFAHVPFEGLSRVGHATGVCVRADDDVWVATDNAGLLRFDGARWHVVAGDGSFYNVCAMGDALIAWGERGLWRVAGTQAELFAPRTAPDRCFFDVAPWRGGYAVGTGDAVVWFGPDGRREVLRGEADEACALVARGDELLVSEDEAVWRLRGEQWERWPVESPSARSPRRKR